MFDAFVIFQVMFNKMASSSRENNENAPPAPKANQKMTIEKIYQKKSQLEHILLRPDTYIGSVEKSTETMWIYDKDSDMIKQKEITYVPGMFTFVFYLFRSSICFCNVFFFNHLQDFIRFSTKY